MSPKLVSEGKGIGSLWFSLCRASVNGWVYGGYNDEYQYVKSTFIEVKWSRSEMSPGLFYDFSCLIYNVWGIHIV